MRNELKLNALDVYNSKGNMALVYKEMSHQLLRNMTYLWPLILKRQNIGQTNPMRKKRKKTTVKSNGEKWFKPNARKAGHWMAKTGFAC